LQTYILNLFTYLHTSDLLTRVAKASAPCNKGDRPRHYNGQRIRTSEAPWPT